MLPDEVLDHILGYLSTKSIKQLSENFKRVSHSYRSLDCKNTGSTKEDVDAYLVGRLPLTFAVIVDLLQKIKGYLPSDFSVTDYGAGPATALLALHHVFEGSVIDYLAIEEKEAMKEAAIYLASKLDYHIKIQKMDVQQAQGFHSDLAIVSYLLNELKNLDQFFEVLFKHHEHILVIEPGTPDGYQRILQLRNKALLNGFHVVAPCCHEKKCPLQGGDWCHFYLRCQRPKILKQIKEGTLGYEDEKYSYIFLSKKSASVHQGVILEKPTLYPFKIDLKVCSQEGTLKKMEVLKKDKQVFKKAKKLSWGDFL